MGIKQVAARRVGFRGVRSAPYCAPPALVTKAEESFRKGWAVIIFLRQDSFSHTMSMRFFPSWSFREAFLLRDTSGTQRFLL